MIQNDITYSEYKYYPQDLSKCSNKSIIVDCDYCHKHIIKSNKARYIQNKVLDKDCCEQCRFKKREEISLLLHGVKNSSQRLDNPKSLKINSNKDNIILMISDGWSISNISNKLGIPRSSLNRTIKSWGLDTKGKLQDKKDKTLIEKYGSSYKIKISENRNRTNLERFGTDNVFQNEDIKQKIKDTNLRVRGVSHHAKDPNNEILKQNTNLIKYGVKNVAQVEIFKEATKETNLKRYGYTSATKNIEVKKKIVNTMISNGNARFYENKNSKEWAEETGYCLSRFNQLVSQYGFEVATTMEKGNRYSSLEQILKNWLDEENISYSQQHRVSHDNGVYISDFKIDNLLIEIDGLYWHSDATKLDKNYHIMKRLVYSSNNFRSLFFREDELNDKFDIIKSIILNRLGKSNRIFARKCSIGVLSNKESDQFYEINHLMGKGRGQTYCLLYDNEIVSCLRLKRLKHKDYEVSRFCCSKGTGVVGGFSKLLNYAIEQINPSSIMTFIDLRYGDGSYLSDLGFKYNHTYPSFKWTDGQITLNRLRFPGNSGYDHGLFKIWDCGQAKWIYSCL